MDVEPSLPVSIEPPGAARRDDELAAEVLGAIVELSEQLHPHQRGRAHAGLDGDLDRAFGLDSLGRVEVVHRLEALFNITLPDSLFAEAGTPLDLVKAIRE